LRGSVALLIEIIERLMAGQDVTIAAEPFVASFQLDGSRSALCSMMNKCGDYVSGCGGGDKSSRKEDGDGQDGKINCGRGRTWVGAQGKCVCVDSNRSWNGSRCVRSKTNRPKGCSGGRTFEPQTGRCECNGDSAWNGRACVKQNEPAPNNNNEQVKKAVCATLQIACSLGQQDACKKFNNGCPCGRTLGPEPYLFVSFSSMRRFCCRLASSVPLFSGRN
jgi:hypothetical protein